MARLDHCIALILVQVIYLIPVCFLNLQLGVWETNEIKSNSCTNDAMPLSQNSITGLSTFSKKAS